MIRIHRTLNLLAGGLLALMLTSAAIAQSTGSKPAETKSSEVRTGRCDIATGCVLKTYFLNHTYQQSDTGEILVALRNMLDSSSRLILIQSRRSIEVLATPEQQTIAQKIINDLDRPQKSWRLTYTIAESDGGKRIGIQHFSFVLAEGQRTVVKQGSKIPVMTGTYQPAGGAQTQFQYIDIGMNFDATIDNTPGGIFLRTKVEQSAVGNPSEYGNNSGPLAGEPIIHQTSLEGSSIMAPGKPLTLGSVDVAGSTRHIDIEVVAEPLP